MRSYSLFFVLTCFCECFSLPSIAQRGNSWSEVIMVEVGKEVSLCCSEEPSVNLRHVNWMVMPANEKQWIMLFSVNISRGRQTGNKINHRKGKILEISDRVFLRFTATAECGGRYSCVLEKEDRSFKERIVLLAIIKLTVAPAPVIPIDSTVRLKAEVSPSYAVVGGTWFSHTSSPLLTDVSSPGILLTKLPRVAPSDSGIYNCNITVEGQSSKPVYSYKLPVTVSVKQVAFFPNITYAQPCKVAVLSYSAVVLPCSNITGDYVLLYWWHLNSPNVQPKLIFQFDRWRNSRNPSDVHVQLYNHSSELSGKFSFLLRPELKDAGTYQCEVFKDDQVFAQVTEVTVLHGYSRIFSSSVKLDCAYSTHARVASIKWSHIQKPKLHLDSSGVLGRISISVDLPITRDTAGQYACTLKLKNGQTVRYIYTAMMPSTEPPCCVSVLPDDLSTSSAISLPQPTESTRTPEPSVLLPSLSLLLFLTPMLVVAGGVFLWRRGACTFTQNVARTLSHYSGEVENIYENPEDVRQSSPQSAVYMDLKFTEETDVYRELDRYDQCCG